jgi:hypothetical protein
VLIEIVAGFGIARGRELALGLAASVRQTVRCRASLLKLALGRFACFA